jgi:hypothetical protein
LTGPFVAAAAARGTRPPLRLQGEDSRGWSLATKHGDTLVLDEFGDLWWARLVGPSDVRVIRSCWPEEVRGLRAEIAKTLLTLDDIVL